MKLGFQIKLSSSCYSFVKFLFNFDAPNVIYQFKTIIEVELNESLIFITGTIAVV